MPARLDTHSAVDAWAECVGYLERHCNLGRLTPYSPIDYRYALVLWTFAECAAAQVILEIGVGPESVSGCTFVHALGRQGGHLISVDLDPALPQQQYKDLAAEKGVSWRVVHGDSLDASVQVPVPKHSVDLLYIDGNHDA